MHNIIMAVILRYSEIFLIVSLFSFSGLDLLTDICYDPPAENADILVGEL